MPLAILQDKLIKQPKYPFLHEVSSSCSRTFSLLSRNRKKECNCSELLALASGKQWPRWVFLEYTPPNWTNSAKIPKERRIWLLPKKMFVETRREGQTRHFLFRASNEIKKNEGWAWPIISINAGRLIKEADGFLLVREHSAWQKEQNWTKGKYHPS